MKKVLIFFLFLLFEESIPSLSAATANQDSIRISLLTCSAGEEVYSLYGHTAIRYTDSSRGIDVVFNYGMFDFETPNFIYRFTKGETDYQLGVEEFERFARSYAFHNRSVEEQVLNLSETEKTKLLALLEENYRRENRIYRYNFFYDNCATRPRDKIEECIEGHLVYQYPDTSYTFRQLIHQYTDHNLWSRFGIGLCLGSKADEKIDPRKAMFIPFYLRDDVQSAHIIDSAGIHRDLVLESHLLIPKEEETEHDSITSAIPSPFQCALLLFMITTLLSIYGIKKKKSLWIYDAFLFASAGIVGCILTFLVCCSEHPAVSPNYLLFVFHPLHLILLPYTLYKESHRGRRGQKWHYHTVNLVILTLFVLFFFLIPQKIELAVVPLALSLWVRSLSQLTLTYNIKK